jgi:two-component system response regulator YesN
MKIRVTVAEDDPAVLGELQNYLKDDILKMDVIHVAPDEADLLNYAASNAQELVIVSADIPGMDAFSAIRGMRERDAGCHFILMSQRKAYDVIYAAWNMGISGFLPKPLDKGATMALLERVGKDVRRMATEQIEEEHHHSMRSLYFWKIMFGDNVFTNDIGSLNGLLATRFSDGLFRVILLRLDDCMELSPVANNLSFNIVLHETQNYVKLRISELLTEYTFDVIYDYGFNGVLAILNYPIENDQAVLYKLPALLERAQKHFREEYGIQMTMCVGGAYRELKDVAKSREEAYNASWLRLSQGVGRIIYWKQSDNLHQRCNEKLSEAREKLYKVALTLNIDDFEKGADMLFSIPATALSHHETRRFIQKFIDHFLDVNREMLDKHLVAETLKENIQRMLDFANTFSQYRATFKTSFREVLELLGDESAKCNVMPIRKAKGYIEQHYSQQITIDMIANVVNLNPVYFSHLFKKQTGMSLTECINNCRMDAAKQLLRNTDLIINEISSQVGFQDQRYFSIKFRKAIGMTPSAYRKSH